MIPHEINVKFNLCHFIGEKIQIEKSKTTVGRKGTDISLAGDDSISRSHAILVMTASGLTVQDSGSKYGTFIISGNKTQKVEKNPVKVTNGNRIRFGKLGNDWTVQKAAAKRPQPVARRQEPVEQESQLVEEESQLFEEKSKPVGKKPVRRLADSIEQSSSLQSSELPASFDLPATNTSSKLLASDRSFDLPATSDFLESSSSRFNTNRAETSSSFCSELPATNFSSELPGSSTSSYQTAKQSSDEPVAKKRKVVKILDDSDDEPPSQSARPNRKRPASDIDGGLFSFNTKFAKKPKSKDKENESQEARGILLLSKPREPSPVRSCSSLSRKSTQGHLDDMDDCVWLSKKMLSTNLVDTDDGIKSEIQIIPIKIENIKKELTMDSEDVKPSQLGTLFNVLEPTLTASTTTSLVSKRKQFVKKSNFKPQSRVVTTKTVKVEDTFVPLDAF